MRSYQVGDSEYVLIKKIGQGQFGDVYQARRTKKTGIELYSETGALKIIKICDEEKFRNQMFPCNHNERIVWEYFAQLERDALSEVQNQKKVLQEDDSCIVNIKECDIYKEKYEISLLIFMELLTPLTDILKTRDLREHEIFQLGKQIATALKVCHGNHIYHRDLKASNIFITKKGDFKLGDFGISKMMTGDTYAKTVSGTLWYMAPEIAKNKGRYRYNESVDIYSLGILLYYLFNNGRYPFLPLTGSYGERELDKAFARKMQFDKPNLPVNAPKAAADVILQAIQCPEERISNAVTFLQKWEKAIHDQKRVSEEKEPGILPSEGRDKIPGFDEENPVLELESIEIPVDRRNEDKGKKTGKSGKSFIIVSLVAIPVLVIISAAIAMNHQWISRFLQNKNQIISEETDERITSDDSVNAQIQKELESTVEYIYEDNVLLEYRGESKEVILPDGLKGIGSEAFSGNLKLTRVEIPEGTKFIAEEAFKDCGSLKEVKFADSIEYIGDSAFSRCEKLQQVVLPQNLMEIGNYAFLNCKELKRIDFPQVLESIGKMAFISCVSLEKIELGSHIRSIEDGAFQSCVLLKEVVIHSTDCELKENVFSSCDEKLLILCTENSGAHAYAVENGNLYQLIQY